MHCSERTGDGWGGDDDMGENRNAGLSSLEEADVLVVKLKMVVRGYRDWPRGTSLHLSTSRSASGC